MTARLRQVGGGKYDVGMILKRKAEKARVPEALCDGAAESTGEGAKRERLFLLLAVVVLVGFATFEGVWYWGHQRAPNSDFPAFSRVGRDILTLQAPYNYKRVPVWGMLHVSLAAVIGGTRAELTAALLLNAGFHVANAVLLYLIGGRTIGKRGAVWFALAASCNPWVLRMMVDPIVETCLLFFTLLTLYLIMRGTRWAYLAAAAATMTRYEGAGLIAAAFVIDMLFSQTKRDRLWSVGCAVLAGLPLGLWLLGTKLRGSVAGTSHYLSSFGTEHGTYKENLLMAWRVGVSSFYQYLRIDAVQGRLLEGEAVAGVSKVVTAGLTVSAAVYGVVEALKRRWQMLAVLIYLGLYVLVHAMRPAPHDRYYAPVAFAVLLTVWHGAQGLWAAVKSREAWLRKKAAGGAALLYVWGPRLVMAAVVIGAVVWMASLQEVQAKFRDVGMSPRSQAVLPVALAVVAMVFVGRRVLWGKQQVGMDVTLAVVTAGMLVSNQLSVAQVMGRGDQDIEFVRLTDWWLEQEEEEGKLLCSLTTVLTALAPQERARIVHTRHIAGSSLAEYVEDCYEQRIAYIAWDSRLGLARGSSYHKRYNMDKLLALSQGKTLGPCEFVKRIAGASQRRWINLYRLRMPTEAQLRQVKSLATLAAMTDWFRADAGEEAVLVTSRSRFVKILAGDDAKQIRGWRAVKGEGLAAVAEACRERGVSHVAWDSRIGANEESGLHEAYGMAAVKALAEGEDVGAFRFVRRFGEGDDYVNVFAVLDED